MPVDIHSKVKKFNSLDMCTSLSKALISPTTYISIKKNLVIGTKYQFYRSAKSLVNQLSNVIWITVHCQMISLSTVIISWIYRLF